MPLFRNKDVKTDNKNDPKPKEPDPNADPNTDPNAASDYVPKADFDQLKENYEKLSQKFEDVNLRIQNFGQPAAQPAQPPGPTEAEKLQEQISKKQTEVAALNKEFDDAYANAKPLGEIISRKDTLQAEIADLRAELKFRPQIEQLEAAGGQALEQLSETVTAGQMPHLSIPEVKRTFDTMIKNIPANSRMNPQTRMQVYKYAVGENFELLLEQQKQEAARQSAENIQTQDASTAGTGRQHQTQTNAVPKPEEILSADNLMAIRSAGKTVDGYYQSLGYKGGWQEFWETTGKDHYSEEGETA